MLIIYLLSVIMALFIYVKFSSKGKSRDYPPGPFSWPIFGNLLQLGVKPWKSVMEMRKKYGDIIAIDLGTRRSVFINEQKLVREAFSNDVFSGRCQMKHFFEPVTGLPKGIVFASGKIWAEQRKFAFTYIQSALRNVAGKETLVLNEISELVDQLKTCSGKAMDMTFVFNISATNTLWLIIAGRKYSIHDQAFMKMIKHNSKLLRSTLVMGILLFYPKFSEMFPRLSGYKKFRKHVLPMLEFMENTIEEHRKTYQDGIERDFIDAYLHTIKTTTDPNSSFYGETAALHLRYAIQGLFTTGSDTVSAVLQWTVFLMAYYPQIQKKMIYSIRLHCEQGKPILLKDRPSLPFVDAVINEVLRFASVAPLGLFRETREDVEFHGYRLPKGTVVVINQYCMMHDPEVWGDPENFRPERFLSEDGLEVVHQEKIVAFSAGLRGCPGESFARDELFLFITNIFKNFEVSFDPSRPIPPLKYKTGNLLTPVDHQIIFQNIQNLDSCL